MTPWPLIALAILVSSAHATDLLLVGWDGADYRRVAALEEAGGLPNLRSLGPLRELRIEEATMTKASWSMELSGLPWTQTGMIDNTTFKPLPQGATIFEELQAKGFTSIYVAGKCKDGVGNMCIGGLNNPFRYVRKSVVFGKALGTMTAPQVTEACKQGLSFDPKFAFCHYKFPDEAGHLYGGGSQEYDDALRASDVELGLLLGSATHVMVTSDHGFEMRSETPSRFAPPLDHRSYPFGFGHRWEPHAIMVSDLPLREPATGRDVFKTLCAVLGIECIDRPDGDSLYSENP